MELDEDLNNRCYCVESCCIAFMSIDPNLFRFKRLYLYCILIHAIDQFLAVVYKSCFVNLIVICLHLDDRLLEIFYNLSFPCICFLIINVSIDLIKYILTSFEL